MNDPTPDEIPEADELIPPGCSLFFTWIFASAVGLGIGWAAGWRLSFLLPGLIATVVIGGTAGLVQGFFQWLLLRAHRGISAGWIVASALGWGAGFSLGVLAAQWLGMNEMQANLLSGAVTGACLGAVQWVFLRGKGKQTVWWIPAAVFGLAAAFMFYRPGVSGWGFYYGLLYGIPTSVALLWILYTGEPGKSGNEKGG